MRYVFFSVLFAMILAGCDGPGPGFSRAEVTRVSAGENQFSLRRNGNLVQIIRTNFARRPDIAVIGRQAELLVEATYGCPVIKMSGDVALMVGQMDCDRPLRSGEWARWVRPKRSQVSCLGDVFGSGNGRFLDAEFRCF